MIKSVKNEIVESKRITEKNGHFFFGYYDIPAFSQNQKFHLAHRTDLWDRLPNSDEPAKIGVIDLQNNKFIQVTETSAWNFQQGSMLQWHPSEPNSKIIFNTKEENQIKSIILDINTQEKKILESPVACVSPTGAHALGINFGRLMDFRPVCGYSGVKDKFKDYNHPQEDGVFLIDMESGKSKLIVSYDQIWNVSKGNSFTEDQKITINHITFNKHGTRFVMLVRNFPSKGERWRTAIVTANTDGSDLYCLSDYTYVSHYSWKDDEYLLFYMDGPYGNQLYLVKDKSPLIEPVDPNFFLTDGHCSYSPDGKWILYDSYPDIENYRNLYIYNIKERRGITLGSYFSYPKITGDIRCDLHPRWDRTGTAISFDSIHEGQRHIYYMDLKQLVKDFV